MRHRDRRINPASPVPKYHQLAALLRDAIHRGEYAPGERLPTLRDLAHEYEIGIDTAKDAIAILRREGLVDVRQGEGTRVRAAAEQTVIPIGPNRKIASRMPTEEERGELGIGEGVPVFVISEPGQEDRIVPAGPHSIIETTPEEQPDEGTDSGPEC